MCCDRNRVWWLSSVRNARMTHKTHTIYNITIKETRASCSTDVNKQKQTTDENDNNMYGDNKNANRYIDHNRS